MNFPNGKDLMHGISVLTLVAFFALASGATAETLLETDTEYSTVIVEEADGLRFLYFGHGDARYTQSALDLSDPNALPVPYTQYMTLALAYAGQLDRVAEIGSATGQTANYLARHLPDAQVVGVELDGAILQIARTHFDMVPAPNLSLVESDGRVFLRRARDRFDVILVDAYRGPFVPFHLTTQEFYERAASRLSAGGVFALNIDPHTLLYEATLLTLTSVFDRVDIYEANENRVVIAYSGEEISTQRLTERASELDKRHGFRHPLAPMVLDRAVFVTPPGEYAVLTDDFAPTEFLLSVQRHNTAPADADQED